MNPPADELWPHFEPLWRELQRLSPGTLLTGGYALFLKQQWLSSQAGYLLMEDGSHLLLESGQRMPLESHVSPLVEIYRWVDPAPRVTNDLDFVVELNLIAAASEQSQIDDWLFANGFEVVEGNRRWQFAKQLSDAKRVVVDFHAAPPSTLRNDIRVESRRVKPHPSLGQRGIHARENREAIGCELHPSRFQVGDIEIAIPNPVTLALMKLIAMRDRRLASLTDANSAEEREFEDQQARKHAQDVCRTVALLTRTENAVLADVLAHLRGTSVFASGADVFQTYFGADTAWALLTVALHWRTDDLKLICATLANWLSIPTS